MASRLLLCIAVLCFFSYSRSEENVETKDAIKGMYNEVLTSKSW